MPQFETIATFTLPSELAIAKSKLESEGIPCRTQDELTVQSYNFISNAIGGVKLQVEEKNLEKAIEILKEGGFIIDESAEPSWVEKKMNNPVFYKRLKVFSLVFLSAVGIVLIAFLVVMLKNRPTLEEQLIRGNWCLDYIEYGQQAYFPHTITDKQIRVKTLNDCFEHFDFKSSGILEIPGFNTKPLNGNWSLNNDQLNILNIDTLDFAFEGAYTFTLTKTELIMESDSTRIFCYKSGYY